MSFFSDSREPGVGCGEQAAPLTKLCGFPTKALWGLVKALCTSRVARLQSGRSEASGHRRQARPNHTNSQWLQIFSSNSNLLWVSSYLMQMKTMCPDKPVKSLGFLRRLEGNDLFELGTLFGHFFCYSLRITLDVYWYRRSRSLQTYGFQSSAASLMGEWEVTRSAQGLGFLVDHNKALDSTVPR